MVLRFHDLGGVEGLGCCCIYMSSNKTACTWGYGGPAKVYNMLFYIYKLSGVENISSKVLKDAFSVLYVELTSIFNVSLNTGIFPDAWKIGNITPIPKEGNVLEANNRRPVTLLPLPSKLLEKAVHYQKSNYLSNENILSERQHGLRPDLSTATAIFKVVKDFFVNYNLRESTMCAFIDYRKAYETLDHPILIRKLVKYGFEKGAVDWLSSYLTERKHRVYCNNMLSDISDISYGVPHGSVLGPLLFIIYVNDLLSLFETYKGVNIEMYADDTILYSSNCDVSIATSHCEEALKQLSAWCINNKLTINTKKTKVMSIARNDATKEKM